MFRSRTVSSASARTSHITLTITKANHGKMSYMEVRIHVTDVIFLSDFNIHPSTLANCGESPIYKFVRKCGRCDSRCSIMTDTGRTNGRTEEGNGANSHSSLLLSKGNYRRLLPQTPSLSFRITHTTLQHIQSKNVIK